MVISAVKKAVKMESFSVDARKERATLERLIPLI
jgi:hypothetical protein